MTFPNLKTVFVLMLAAFALSACVTTNPATGKKEFTIVSPAQEAQIGAEQNPQFVAEYGGAYDDQALANYVQSVGDRIAGLSDMPDTDFQFTVLNSPIINAFALPGGYVNISRGLMAYFNDEAEMAGVLGHEIGHVTARHFAKRYTQATIFGLGTAAVGQFVGSDTVSGIASTGANLILLKNSRSDETEADKLSVRYVGRAGYDLYGTVRMLERIVQATGRQGAEASWMETWTSTHPADDKRVQREKENVAAATQPSNPIVNRDRYLDAIDGMLFGDDPAQGVIKGHEFLHPVLRLAFTSPDVFQMQNTAQYVIGAAQNAQFAFAGGEVSSGTSTKAYLDQVWSKLFDGNPPTGLSNYKNLSTNGMDGVSGSARITNDSGTLDVTVVAWRYDATHAYHFVLISTPDATSGYTSAFNSLVMSFRKISSSEAAAIKPTRIKVVTVRSGDTVSGLAQQMAVDENKEDLFRALNGLGDGDTLQAGQRVKIVVEG